MCQDWQMTASPDHCYIQQVWIRGFGVSGTEFIVMSHACANAVTAGKLLCRLHLIGEQHPLLLNYGSVLGLRLRTLPFRVI